MEMTPEQKSEVKISALLKRGMEVVNKVTAKEMLLNKTEMIDLLNFETAVKFIIEAEDKAEKAKADAEEAKLAA